MVVVILKVLVRIMFVEGKSTCVLVEFCALGIGQCVPLSFKGDLPARNVFRRPCFVNTLFTHMLKLVTTVNSTSPLRNGLFSSSLG